MNVAKKLAALVLVAAAGAWAYYANVASGRMSMDMNMRVTSGSTPFPVTLAAVERGRITESVSYTGSVAAFNEEDVFPRVTGRIVEMPVYPGDRVERGQVVARLDDVELGSKVREAAAGARAAEANVAQMDADVVAARQGVVQMEKELVMAAAEVAAARDGVTQMQKEVAMAEAEAGYQQGVAARDERLFGRGAIGKQEAENSAAMAVASRAKVQAAQAKVEQAGAMVRAAEAKLEAARAKLDQAKAMEASAFKKRDAMAAMAAQSQAMLRTNEVVRDYVNIRAASNGYVVKRLVAPGVLVQPGMAILKVAQIDKVRLQANVGEKDLASIKVGSPVAVTTIGAGGPPLNARVTSVFPFVDQGPRTAVVEAVVENAGRRFLPGQYVQMQFVTGERGDALIVPRGAVQRMGGKAAVWVAKDDRTEPVEVTTGLENADQVEIAKGLQGGERIIARGHEGLYAGARIADASSPARARPEGEQHKGMPGMTGEPPKAVAPSEAKEPQGHEGAAHGPGGQVAQAPATGREAGDLRINLTTVPANPRAGSNRLRIEVKDQAGAPVAGATVGVSYTMAMPGMAATKVKAMAAKDAGIYEATVNTGMAGTWTVDVAVTRPGGGPAAAKFTLEAK